MAFVLDCSVTMAWVFPACTGEPEAGLTKLSLAEVYPRVCGGTRYRYFRGDYGVGLSPRVRGNLSSSASPYSALRSIPACAGEPRRGDRARRRYGVYPRVCGGTRPQTE